MDEMKSILKHEMEHDLDDLQKSGYCSEYVLRDFALLRSKHVCKYDKVLFLKQVSRH